MSKKVRSHRFYEWRLDRLASVGQYTLSNYVVMLSWRELLKHKGTKKLRRYMQMWMCMVPPREGIHK